MHVKTYPPSTARAVRSLTPAPPIRWERVPARAGEGFVALTDAITNGAVYRCPGRLRRAWIDVDVGLVVTRPSNGEIGHSPHLCLVVREIPRRFSTSGMLRFKPTLVLQLCTLQPHEFITATE
jgi:hypothetical protein